MSLNLAMSNMLNINARPVFDSSITRVEYHAHAPYANTSYESNDEIRIPIQQQDLYVLPSDSFLYIEGTLLNSTPNAQGIYEPVKDVKLVNNAAAFLFDEIRYELNGVEIDRCRNVGITTAIKNYLSFSENAYKALEVASWSLSGTLAELNHGHFNYCIPLRILLGFCEDYKRVIANARHELVLIRSRNDTNAIWQGGAVAPKLKVIKLHWRMPHISVEDLRKLELLQLLESGATIQMSFRSWDLYEYPILQQTTHHTWSVKTAMQLEKPRYVILALQTNRRNQLAQDPSVFDHCELTNVRLYLNSESYPYDNLDLDFNRKRFALLYDMYAKFKASYYGEAESPEPMLDLDKFETRAPLAVIDCSRQNESLKSASVDIRLEFQCNANVPANTTAYCLILHDKIIEYSPLTNVVRKMV